MVALTRQSLGQDQRDVSIFEQQAIVDNYTPTTGAVTGAFIEEAFEGVGTLQADLRAYEVEDATGSALTPEDYKASEYFRPEIDYYEGMTTGAAQILAENQDDVNRRNFIIGNASTGQQILGFGSAFGAGLFEPKNLGIGIATALVGGTIISQVGSARRIYQMSMQARKFQTRAGLGAVEGLVAATIAEPSNRDSAKILQQDYGMADSAMNVALSTVLGAGLNSVPGFIGDKMKLRKLNKITAKLQAEALDEIDMATAQVAQGKELDVSSVSKSNDVNISKLDVETKAAKVEEYVRYTETEQFKTRFEGSKVVDESGAPLRVYKAMYPYDWTKETASSPGPLIEKINRQTEFPAFNGDEAGVKIAGFFGDMATANQFAARAGTQQAIYPSYLQIKNPFVIDAKGAKAGTTQFGESGKPFRDAIRSGQYDGVIIRNTADEGDIYVALTPDQIIPAFGDGDLNVLARKIDTNNKQAVVDAVKKDNEPTNDTGIDWQTAKELDEYENTTLDEQIQYEQEIMDLREQGLLTEADELALQQINDMDLEGAIAAHEAAYYCLTKG